MDHRICKLWFHYYQFFANIFCLNLDKDTLTLVGFGYESEEDILANVIETLDGSVLFNDQGTEVELLGVSLDAALNMNLVLY